MFQVLIIGGGDGGIAREVAKHDVVKRIVQCEIDAVLRILLNHYIYMITSHRSNL